MKRLIVRGTDVYDEATGECWLRFDSATYAEAYAAGFNDSQEIKANA